MEKRYQVFVSSTFADLSDERGKVIQNLMKMDCIPASMEFFTAVDDAVFEFIKRVIDDCDYYVLIIGGRYGSVDAEGVSYTEKEYDYAMEKGLSILAFIHDNPQNLTFEKSEGEAAARKKLEKFRKRVATGRIVEKWTIAEELAGMVTLSLISAIKLSPAIGWVRANKVGNEDILTELNDLRKNKEELDKKLLIFKEDEIKTIDESILYEVYSFKIRKRNNNDFVKTIDIQFGLLFELIAPNILVESIESIIIERFTRDLLEKYTVGLDFNYNYIPETYLNAVKIRLYSLDLIEISKIETELGSNNMDTWCISDLGKSVLPIIVASRNSDSD